MRLILLMLLIVASSACAPRVSNSEKRAILSAYRELAFVQFDEAYRAAQQLDKSIHLLIVEPGPERLNAARQAWRQARIPYSQTEALRFGHWFVDEWEAKVNSWPLDEGFIDYVDARYHASPTNPWSMANIVMSDSIDFKGRQVPLPYIVNRQLEMFQALSDVESIVVTGYHALEFMLWGQDNHGNRKGAGDRPWTDFVTEPGRCTNGLLLAETSDSCRKRGEFLRAVSLLLLQHLQEMRQHWSAAEGSPGYRLVHGDVNIGLSRVLFGMSTMAAEELAGERIQVALMTHAPEEEQDCFSDDTHNSLWYNALGIENFYYGRYRGLEAELTVDHSLSQLAWRLVPELAAKLDASFSHTREIFAEIREQGERGNQAFDQLIAADNQEGRELLERAVKALQLQSELLNQLAEQLGLRLIDPASFGSKAA